MAHARHVADLYLYPNGLRVVKIDGATLSRMAGALSRHVPKGVDPAATASAAAARSPAFASYNFDVIAGVTYTTSIVTQPSRYDSEGDLVDAGGSPHRRSQVRGQADRRAPVVPRRHQ